MQRRRESGSKQRSVVKGLHRCSGPKLRSRPGTDRNRRRELDALDKEARAAFYEAGGIETEIPARVLTPRLSGQVAPHKPQEPAGPPPSTKRKPKSLRVHHTRAKITAVQQALHEILLGLCPSNGH